MGSILGPIPWEFVAVALFVLIQGAFIIGLLVSQARHRQREAETALVADISSKFVNLPPVEVDREIVEAQRRLCESLDIDLSALWQWSDRNRGGFTATHLYSLQHGPQPPIQMSEDDFPWVRKEILAGRIVAHRSLDEMPAEAAKDKEAARQLGIKSHLTLPLAVGGERPIGVLGFNTMRADRRWPDALVKRLQLIAQIFANALARKRADETLRESELRLSLAAESAEAGLWELEWSTQDFWANERARGIFGFHADESITMARFEAIVHPADLNLVRESIRQAVTKVEPINVEYRIKPVGGSERWIVSRGRPFFKSTGEPERLLGLSMEITERKRADGQLHQLSLAVEQSPVLVIITDLQGKIIYVNRKFSEVSGYSFEECIGRNPRLLKSGECPPSTYQELWACITSGNIWRGEFHNRKKNGELYWERAVISPLLDAAGKVTHFVGVKEDITAEKLAEAAFHAAKARLAAGTELAELGYFEADYGAGTCFLDDRFREICGVPLEVHKDLEPVRYWMEHVHPDDLPRILHEREQLHSGKIDKVFLEYRYQHPVRGQRWLHHSARCAGGSATEGGIRTHGVVRDISPRKEAEAEALELRNNLTHLSRVNILGALSGSLAHELNQPLGIILSNAQAARRMLAKESPDLPELREIIDDIIGEDRRAGEVITRLRALLKRGETRFLPLALNAVIEDVVRLLRSDLVSRGVTIETALAGGLPDVAGDQVQLQQVMLNLILNGCDAMAENAPPERTLRIHTRLQQGKVRISVEDQGCGLPEGDADRIFQPFVTTKTYGLGIGLSICRSIIAAHHGNLWAEPNEGRGTTLHVELQIT